MFKNQISLRAVAQFSVFALVGASLSLKAMDLESKPLPPSLNITCQSTDIGKIELNLNSPNGFGSSENFYYKINSKRYHRTTQEFLGSEEYPINVHSNDARAVLSSNSGIVHLYPEPTLYLQIPAFGVDWQKHAKECYRGAPSYGFSLTLGLESNKIYQDRSKSYERLYQTNPRVTFVMVPGVPFAHPQDVLDGKHCPDLDQWKLSDEIVCTVKTQ